MLLVSLAMFCPRTMNYPEAILMQDVSPANGTVTVVRLLDSKENAEKSNDH